jgi:pimeloyl-ACP methyl ester carboxylesterase
MKSFATMTVVIQFALATLFVAVPVSNAYCPVVICPGFGNDAIDYDTPLEQPSEVGLKSVLARRGFDPEQIYTVPVQRSDWLRVAGGLLDIPNFYTGNALATGKGYGWYVQRLKDSVDLAYDESGGDKVLLIGHSAGGWLARAALGDGTWCEDEGVSTSERVGCLVTIGAIHAPPEEESTCVTRGALKNTNLAFPGAFLKDQGVKYVSVGGAAVEGEMIDRKIKDFSAQAQRVAYNSYEAVSGTGGQIGDGVVPFPWTQLEGSKQIRLDGVVHSINEAGTTMPTDRWYGSEDVIDRWLPEVLDEMKINASTGGSNGINVGNAFDMSSLKNLASNLFGNGKKNTIAESAENRDSVSTR